MKIVTIANKKGGVGKTTTAFNLAAGLANADKRVLAIDLDSQCNFSDYADTNKDAIDVNDVLCGGEPLTDAIQVGAYFDFVGANRALTQASKKLPSIVPELTLKSKLEAIPDLANRYDYIIIDTPPNTEILTLNALIVSDYVVVPAPVEAFALEGLLQLHETLDQINTALKSNVSIGGILLSMYNDRLNNTKSLLPAFENVASNFNTRIFESHIHRNTDLAAASTNHKSIFEYAPKSQGAQDYANFVTEFIKEC